MRNRKRRDKKQQKERTGKREMKTRKEAQEKADGETRDMKR